MLVLPFIKYFMNRHTRQRFKVHTGTNTEVAIDLADYGMKKKHLPESMGGEYNHGIFQDWCVARLLQESQRELTENVQDSQQGQIGRL